MTEEKRSTGGCPVDHDQLTAEDLARLPTPPGEDGPPVVGKTLQFIGSSDTFARTMREKYGRTFYAKVLGSRTVFCNTPEVNRWIFTGENDYLQNRWSQPIRTLIGRDSVAALQGDAHRKRRAVLNPHFKYEQMDAFIPTIRDTIERYLEAWAAQDTIVSATANRNLAFEIICSYVFGDIDDLPLSSLRDNFMQWTRGIFSAGINLPFTRYGQALQARERLWNQLTGIVNSRQHDDLPPSVLRSLFELKDSDGLSIDTIVDEIQILLFAGHDTTVSALTNILVLLAQHPDVVEKARAEQAAVDPANLTTSRGLKNYPYMDAIIYEGMRLHAPVRGSFREMTEDRCFDGYRIPAGWTVSLRIAGTHRSEHLWDQPDAFHPERFIENEHKKTPFMYIPFGGGPRLCLGQNFAMTVMRLTLACLLRDYRWQLLPDQNLDVQVLPTPLPKDGGLMRFERL
ncbi:MAG: cytochrome P450 [Chloroflexi bacterium]|nr:cytochrome P450 [Chloroflexota bacterium]